MGVSDSGGVIGHVPQRAPLRGLAAGALPLPIVTVGSKLVTATAQFVAIVVVVGPRWWCSYLVCWPLPAALLGGRACNARRRRRQRRCCCCCCCCWRDRRQQRWPRRLQQRGGGGDVVGGGGRERTGDVAHKRWPDVAAKARDLIHILFCKWWLIFNCSVVQGLVQLPLLCYWKRGSILAGRIYFAIL